MSDDVWLQAQKVSKHFGAVVALHEVELAIRLCEVIALVGDNGAGKSTLVKILAGAHPLSSGSIAINNQVVLIDSPVKARSLGIATIFQELALIENLTVLAAGGIDIAVSGVLGISAIFIGWSVEAGWPPGATLVVGTCLGIISGTVIVFGRVPPIIATLGLFGVYRSAIFLLLGGSWISGLPNSLGLLVNSSIAGIPIIAIYILVFYFMGWLILRWFPLGTAILAVGGNEPAARLSGIAVNKAKFFVYALTGFLVGFAALLYVARYRNVETSTGGTIALDAIVAASWGARPYWVEERISWVHF